MNRNSVETVLELGGSASITAGSAMLSTALAFIVGGVLSIVFAWRLAR